MGYAKVAISSGALVRRIITCCFIGGSAAWRSEWFKVMVVESEWLDRWDEL